jgi:hypothetical protein
MMTVLPQTYPERKTALARRWQAEIRRECNRPDFELFE